LPSVYRGSLPYSYPSIESIGGIIFFTHKYIYNAISRSDNYGKAKYGIRTSKIPLCRQRKNLEEAVYHYSPILLIKNSAIVKKYCYFFSDLYYFQKKQLGGKNG